MSGLIDRVAALEKALLGKVVEGESLQARVEAMEALVNGTGGAPAAGGEGQSKKDKKKAAKDAKKAANKKEAPAAGAVDPKVMKAAVKEGGKKGIDVVGMHEMGGLEFFNVSMDECQGNPELLIAAMDAMNLEVDENAEERKGGAGGVGKMLLSAGDKQLSIIAHVPADKKDRCNVKEWVDYVLGPYTGVAAETSNSCVVTGVMQGNMDKDLFPLKMKDASILKSLEFLKSKGCFPEDGDDSDGSFCCFGDDDFPMDE